MSYIKHIDFSVPQFGEFNEVFTQINNENSNTIITQGQFASAPNLDTTLGCRVSFTPGLGTAYYTHDTGQSLMSWHYSTLVRFADTFSGDINFISLRSIDDSVILDIKYLSLTNQLEFTPINNPAISIPFDHPTDWHQLEFSYENSTQQFIVYINGQSASISTLDLNGKIFEKIILGCTYKSNDTTGHIDIDHAIINNQYIGTRFPKPLSSHADAPSRWLLVYNKDNEDSLIFAKYYLETRGLSYANLLGLSLPTDETITHSQYQAMRDQIYLYLSNNDDKKQIMGIFLGYGVPGYYNQSTYTHSTSAHLQTSQADQQIIHNTSYNSEKITRPTLETSKYKKMTAQIDAPTLNEALEMLDKAKVISEKKNPQHNPNAKIYLDTHTGSQNSALFSDFEAWTKEDAITPLNTTIKLNDSQSENDEFTTISSDDFFFGTTNIITAPPEGFFSQPSGRRIFAFQFNNNLITASSLRTPNPNQWLPKSINQGYASGAGTSGIISLSSVTNIPRFLEALSQDWSLAEAWHVACPTLRDKLFLIGDPLMKVSFPKACTKIYQTTLNNTSLIKTLQPHIKSFTIPSNLHPTATQDNSYLITQTDYLGIENTATHANIKISTHNNKCIISEEKPIWPNTSNWPFSTENNQYLLSLHFINITRKTNITQIQLIRMNQNQTETIIYKITPTNNQNIFSYAYNFTQEQICFKWEITYASGYAHTTPTSSLTQVTIPNQTPLIFTQQ